MGWVHIVEIVSPGDCKVKEKRLTVNGNWAQRASVWGGQRLCQSWFFWAVFKGLIAAKSLLNVLLRCHVMGCMKTQVDFTFKYIEM